MTSHSPLEHLIVDQPLDEAFSTFNLLFDRLSESYQGLEQQVRYLKRQLAEQEQQAIEASLIEQSPAAANSTEDQLSSDQWLFGMAHQLRSPLTTLALSVDQLQRTNDLNQHGQIVQRLHDTIENMTGQLDSVLQIVRGRAADDDVFLLDSFASRLSDLLSLDLQQSGHSLEIAVERPDLTCVGKLHALIGATANLIHNAVQAGAQNIQCLVRAGTEGLTVRVQDDGQGSSVAEMEKHFAPYQTTRKQGCGLGLAIARQVAHWHNGSLRCVESSARGTAFEFQLPIVLPEPNRARAAVINL